jgi:hypothetical protein
VDDRLITAGRQHRSRCIEKSMKPIRLKSRAAANAAEARDNSEMLAARAKRIIMLGLGQARFPPDKSSG